MEIDWQNVIFDYDAEANCFTTFEQDEQHFANHQQQNIQVQPVKRTRKEMEEEVIIYQVPLEHEQHENRFAYNSDFQIEEEVFQDDENVRIPQQSLQVPQPSFIQVIFEDDENVKIHQQTSHLMQKSESGDAIYACTSCTLDFPSIAYLKRHQNTKKHQRALKMEQRGRKVNQKRKYVRKNGVKPANFQPAKEVSMLTENLQVNHEVTKRTDNIQDLNSITDLTPEEIELLSLIDDQVMKIESEKSAKAFYENFMDNENEEPAAKVQKLSTVEEIMEDLITSTVQVSQNSQFVQDHRVQAKPTSKIQCQMCPKTFNHQCHYTQHMNIVHTGNKNFKCQKCGKKYPQQELLDIHMENHTRIKPFKCSKCEKSYNTKFDMKRHEQSHNKVKDHICNVCFSGFYRYDHLENHMEIHQRNKGLQKQ